jgi:RimJ/RimL family protein N-acetyltransferase
VAVTPRATPVEPLRDARPNDTPWGTLSWPPSPHVVLSGRSVTLTPCVPESDAQPLFEALDRDAVWQHLAGRPRSVEAQAVALRERIAEGRFVWIVRLSTAQAGLAAGSVVGTSSYLDVVPNDARLEIGATAYRPEVWSTRVNPEAKLLLLRFAFEELGAGRVQLKTDIRNQRSQRAIAGLGAHYEGMLRRYQRRDDGTVRDTVMFSITAEDWPASRERLLARCA